MKKLIYTLAFILIVHCTLTINYCSAQWVQMSNGMGNIIVMSLAASDNNIFAGTLYGVYLSTDNGANWTQTSLNNQWPYALAINGNNIFAGTTNFLGVYLSTNNGTNWTQTSLNNRNVNSLAINGNNVFAGTSSNYGIYLSTDNGTNWTQTSLNNLSVPSLAVNGNNIFAGTSGGGVYLSTDNGTSWTQTSLNNQSIMSLTVNGNNVFAGTSANSVYVSNDNGTSWTQRNEGMGNLYVRSLCILNNYMFAGTQTAGVYRRPLNELITSIKPVSELIPEHYILHQNYPNPFNPVTKIKFDIPKQGFVSVKIFDAIGREIETLVNEVKSPGSYTVKFNGARLTSGVYFYRIQSGEFKDIKSMILIK